jgi:8-oxo-dGTP pyrophosphatase MutT (NUDIX family)
MSAPAPAVPDVGSAPRSIGELLGRYESVAPPIGSAGAAVTIVLRDGARSVEVLLIERTESPADPASGQVALPGGHVDEGDGSLERTAVRELREEVGLRETDLTAPPVYVGTTYAERFRLHVAIFAGALAPRGSAPAVSSEGEVATVFWLPREALGATQRVHRTTSLGLLEVPASVVDGHVLWGFTRRVLREFFGLPVEDAASGPAFVARGGVSSESSGPPA